MSVDNLDVKITSDAQQAVASLDSLIKKLGEVSSKITSINGNALKINFTISGDAEQKIDRLQKYAASESKRIAQELSNAFNIKGGNLKEVQSMLSNIGKDLASGNIKQASSQVESFANTVAESTTSIRLADEQLESFYQTLLAASKIKIDPQFIDSDAWASLDGALRGKLTYNTSERSIDSYANEWAANYPGLFSDADLTNEETQLARLNELCKQARQGIEMPISGNPMGDAFDKAIESALQLERNIKSAKTVLEQTGGLTETKGTGFTELTSNLKKLSNIDVSKLTEVGTAIKSVADGIKSLNGLTANVAVIQELANSLKNIKPEKFENLGTVGNSIKTFSEAMNSAGAVTFDATGFTTIASTVSRLGSKTGLAGAGNLSTLATSLETFVREMNSIGAVTFDATGLERVVSTISRLGSKTGSAATANLPSLTAQLKSFISELNGLKTVDFDVTKLESLATAISTFGRKTAGTAITNIPALATALKNLMSTLATTPSVSNNVLRLVEALAQLSASGSKVGSVAKSISNGFNKISGGAKSASSSLSGLTSPFIKLKMGISGVVGKIFSLYFGFTMIKQGASYLQSAVESAMEYVETLNYFNAGFGQVADNADLSQWEELGYDSAEAYANSFEERAKELSKKMTGFNISDSGELIRTNSASLGLDPERTMSYQTMFAQMSSSMGVASDTAVTLSNALTMIGADLASVKNLDFEDVWEDMASGLTGMSRTLDKYGTNIRVANLQTELDNLGIDAVVSDLGQADKAILRTIVLLDSSRYAWGDLASTINQPANQLRLVQSNFASLARTLGSLFIPIVSKVLPYVNALLIALQRLFSWIAGIFGIKLSNYVSSSSSAGDVLSDLADSADDASDSVSGTGDALSDATDNVEELKEALDVLSFDELNQLSDNSDTDTGSSGSGGSGSGGGGIDTSGLLDDALNDILSEYQAVWDEAFANMQQTASNFADNVAKAFKQNGLYGVGEYFTESLTDALNSIDWDSIYEGARSFGTGLANFLNGLISPELFGAVGKTIASALNTAIYAALSFGTTFDWKDLGESIASGINNFFSTFDFASLAKAINAWVQGLFTALKTAIKNINWLDVYDAIVEFLSNLNIGTVAIIIGALTIKKIGSLIMAQGLTTFVGNALSKLMTNVPVMISNIKILGSGGLVAETGVLTKLTNAMALVAGGAGTLREALVLEFGTAATNIAGVATVITGALTAVLSFVSMLKDGFSGAKEAIMLVGIAITTVGAIILGAAAWPAVLVAAIVAAAATAVVLIKEHWEEIVAFFKELPDRILGFFTGIGDKIVTFFQDAPEKIKEIRDNIVTFFDELPGKIGYALGFVIGKFISWAKECITTIITEVPKIISNIVTFFEELPGKIWDAITDTAKKIADWASDLIDTIKEKFPEVIDAILNFFKDLPENFIQFGKDIIQGLIDGITGMLQDTWDAITDFIDGFIQGFKDGLGINSPSTVMAEIGEYCIEGFINGLENLVNDVIDWFADLPDKIIDALGNAKDWLVEKGENAIEGIKNGWENVKDSKLLSNVKKIGSEVFEKVGNIKDTVKQKGEDAIEGIKSGWESVKESNLLSNVKKIGSEVFTKIGNIKETVKSKGSDAINGIKSGWDSVKNSNLLNTVGKISSEVKTKIGDIKNTVKSKGSDAINGIKSGWDSVKSSNLLSTVGKIGSEMFSKIGNLANTVKSKGSDAISGIKSGWESAKQSGLLNTVGKIGDSIFNTIGNLSNKVNSKGSDIINGLKSGFSDNLWRFTNVVSNIGNNITNAAGNLWNVGYNMIASLRNGFLSLDIPLPHFSWSSRTVSIGNLDISIPSFSVSWYKTGGLFDNPSVIGVGEAGREAVLPLENKKTMSMIADSILENASFTGASSDDIKQAVAEGVAMAMMNNSQNITVQVVSEFKADDVALARAVSKGQQKINYRTKAVSVY